MFRYQNLRSIESITRTSVPIFGNQSVNIFRSSRTYTTTPNPMENLSETFNKAWLQKIYFRGFKLTFLASCILNFVSEWNPRRKSITDNVTYSTMNVVENIFGTTIKAVLWPIAIPCMITKTDEILKK